MGGKLPFTDAALKRRIWRERTFVRADASGECARFVRAMDLAVWGARVEARARRWLNISECNRLNMSGGQGATVEPSLSPHFFFGADPDVFVPHSLTNMCKKRSVAGGSVEPRRRMMPMVRDTVGLRIGRDTRMGCSSRGVAILGKTAIPSPASTSPSDVDRCVTS